MFKNTQWQEMDINMMRKDMRFADMILLTTMIHSLKTTSEKAGLRINFERTKVMTRLIMTENLTVDTYTIQQTDTYKYLEHEFKISRDSQSHE